MSHYRKMKSAILIGCGNIGFRHFQALLNIDQLNSIDLIDLNPEAIQKCLTYAKDLKTNLKKINTHSNLDTIDKTYNVAIVATSSLLRADITCSLLKKTSINYLILEKFLFPKISDYTQVESTLREFKTKTYINCPRRYYPYNQEILHFFKQELPTSLILKGENWSLACNSVHFVDLFSYFLNDQGEFRFTSEGLNPGYVPSKRAEYVEFLGTLKGSIGVASVELTCHETKEPNKISIEIVSPNRRVSLIENGGIAKIELQSGGETRIVEETIPFQSSLTKSIIQDLFETGACRLPTYDISMKEHVSLLKCFLGHYNQAKTEKVDSCPIT